MSERTLQVPIERLERWVTNFAARHGGAAVEPAPEPAAHHDDDAHPGTDARPGISVRVRGGDGEVAEFTPWPSDFPRPGPPGPGDATSAPTLAALRAFCLPPTHLGLILIRRGGYAVGRGQGPDLASHKTGTRYVQSRTAAGGWSQQRFARRRANQADALVGAVAELTALRLLPEPAGEAPQVPQALVVGGDRRLAEQVLADPVLARLAALPRRVLPDLPEPRLAVLREALKRGRSVPVRIIAAD